MPTGIYKRDKNKIYGMKGKHHSLESRIKISIGHKGQIPWCTGKKLSKKHKKKLSLAKIGKKGNHWKGGITIDRKGYILKWDTKKQKYVKEHRFVMEKHVGRYLRPEEVVHHINGIKSDNRIENLYLCFNESEHRKFHKKYQS